MKTYEQIFEHNRAWAADKLNDSPTYFDELASSQKPNFLYIGCSDSRVTAEDIMGVKPGEVFVHRNIANMVISIDLNAMSVINYAVEHLGVKEIIVCGHYNCGGVKAAMQSANLGILNPWLRNIRDVYRVYKTELDGIEDVEQRYKKLVELNVKEQVFNVIKLAALQEAYTKKGFPIVHGWVFDLSMGLIKDLNLDFKAMLEEVQSIYNLTETPLVSKMADVKV
ncbi:MAG: carbonic anhydrase [Pyrinomonadaceae bacterium]|nr:carbonic anhydrase [Pyrinomonadaceae bacterium]